MFDFTFKIRCNSHQFITFLVICSLALVGLLLITDSYSLLFIPFSKSFSSALKRYIQVNSMKNSTGIETKDVDASYIFRELKGRGIYSFYNVCVEKPRNIVIYRGLSDDHVGQFDSREIVVLGAHNSVWNRWQLNFTNASIPSSHTLLPTTAFFVWQIFAENLYHTWNDLFLELFSVVRDSNRLHKGMYNQILYHPHKLFSRVNLSDPACKFCRRTLYDIFQETLHTTKKFFLFNELPPNTCYTSAVFGTRYSGTRKRDAVDHVLKELKLSYKPDSYNKRITFIQRNYRSILNIDDLVNEADRIGRFKTVTVIDFELLPALEQIKIAIDTDVLIGVQGAALQWGIFMKPGSTVVEISWPKKHWGSFFQSLLEYSIKLVKFETDEVHVNWNQYEKRWRRVKSEEERTRLLNSTPPSAWDNLWKFADVTVNVKQFQPILQKLL